MPAARNLYRDLAMRSLGMLIVGAAVLTFALFFPALEPAAEALAAIAFISAVAYGFAMHPRKEVFYVRTTTIRRDVDRDLSVEHDQLAVRVETSRLWLLFIPTALAVAFLVMTSANGTLWHFSVVEHFIHSEAIGLAYGVLRAPFYVIGLGLWIWITERRVLRDAECCSARFVNVRNGRVGFHFVTDKGNYGGGDDFYFGLAKPWEVAALVFYSVNDLTLCKIGMSFLFHRIVVIGRGLTDLDHQTVAAHRLINELTG
jgi:hypothetical protein